MDTCHLVASIWMGGASCTGARERRVALQNSFKPHHMRPRPKLFGYVTSLRWLTCLLRVEPCSPADSSPESNRRVVAEGRKSRMGESRFERRRGSVDHGTVRAHEGPGEKRDLKVGRSRILSTSSLPAATDGRRNADDGGSSVLYAGKRGWVCSCSSCPACSLRGRRNM